MLQDGNTALMYAAWRGPEEIVDLLIENKADINQKGSVSFVLS